MNNTITPEQLALATDVLSRLMVQGKKGHMKRHVNAVLKGMILPAQVEAGVENPEDPNVKKTLRAYSPRAVASRLKPKTVVVPEIVEVPVDPGKCRRIKGTVNKINRKQRDMLPEDRDKIIRWWNANQRLVDKHDPVCETLAAQINAAHPELPEISPLQVAGYLSLLCRWGLKLNDERDQKIMSHMTSGSYTVEPLFSEHLLKAIQENWERERANEEQRIKDHVLLRTVRATGKKILIRYQG